MNWLYKASAKTGSQFTNRLLLRYTLMSSKRAFRVFSPEFLKSASSQEPLSTLEASWAGPWAVLETEGGKFHVHRVGDPTPIVVTDFREIALLIAATLPGAGRGRRYWLSDEKINDNSYGLATTLGERGLTLVGQIERQHEEILTPLSTAEHLVRCPASLAYLIEAVSTEALEQVDRLIADRRTN